MKNDNKWEVALLFFFTVHKNDNTTHIYVKDNFFYYLPKDFNYKDMGAPSAIENIKFCQMISSTNL